ncbi:MAG: hypothetical protein JWM88_680 [Verrucomicrobia bacterium]|nr:hypothetical protein [Verrucomicrobiota bacterium]
MSAVRTGLRRAVGLVLVFTTALCGAAERRAAFDLPADGLDTAMKAFAAQSGRQVIYPTELAQGLKAHRVRGRFTAREALDALLEGTGLSSWEDETTGALAIVRGGWFAVHAPPLQLPPYVVTEDSRAPRWRYAAGPHFEVLSRCGDDVTGQLMSQYYRLHQLLEMILPRRLQFHSDIPTAYLFFTRSGASAISTEILARLQDHEATVAASARPEAKRTAAKLEVSALPNYRFWDQDALSIFFLWEDLDPRGARERLTLTPSYVAYLLQRRTPSLPKWFIQGTLDLYERTRLLTPPATDASYSLYLFEQNPITIQPQVWISPEITQEILKHPNAEVQMPVLGDLFTDEANPDERDDPLRRAETELFLRWVFDRDEPARREALWKFVDRASTGPVTEEIFKACFGARYEVVAAELQGYLRTACAAKITIRPPVPAAISPVELRDATPAEVSRIKGGFNRLEIPYVRELSPGLSAKYIAQARRTLRQSYDDGDRDPRLLAELGLCECDAHDDPAARPFLEAAVDARIVRPRAYYELARIRFAAFRAGAGESKLTSVQLAAVLKPLYLMRGQTPALGEAYDLMGEAWLSSEATPSADQLAALAEGVKHFPRRSRLIFSIALLNAAQGQLAEAGRYVDLGLSVTSDPSERTRYGKLSALIAARRRPK